MKEIWKNIKNYEGLYEVSDLGNVRNAKTKKQLYYSTSNNGYLRVGLFNKKRKMFSIHRLVAEAFISNPNNFDIVNHKDFNKTNNMVSNLEWCDSKYNNNYGYHALKKYISLIEKRIILDYPNECELIEKIKDIKKFISSK